MIHIVGGTYYEKCSEPSYSYLYGSGLRSVIALTGLSNKPVLHTYISKRWKQHLDVLSTTFNFGYKANPISQTIGFSYTHGLSEPIINPNIALIEKKAPIEIEEKNILRFGFMEGDAVVHGDKVIYDPQSVNDPRPFSENGSTAKHLAIVANFHEISKMSGENSIKKIAQNLFKRFRPEIILIKRGPLGATLITDNNKMEFIPAYKTDFVWPIGSGDVFVSIFAHYWAEKNRSALVAGQLASKATSCYCNGQPLPIPPNFQKKNDFKEIKQLKGKQVRKKVYLAGPFFNIAERWLINETKSYLQNFLFDVFSPFHDVGLGPANQVAPLDIKMLKSSDVVFAIANGLDTGTIFEIGYARAMDIPVVVFVQNEKAEDLKMFEGTGCYLINDYVTALYHTTWLMMD